GAAGHAEAGTGAARLDRVRVTPQGRERGHARDRHAPHAHAGYRPRDRAGATVIVSVIVRLKLEEIRRNKKKEARPPEGGIPSLYRLSYYFLSLGDRTHNRFCRPLP